MWELFTKAGILAWPIVACSFVGVLIFFERLRTYRKAVRPSAAEAALFKMFQKGRMDELRETAARHLQKDSRKITSPERIMAEIFTANITDRETLELVTTHALETEMKYLSRHLGILATMGNIAPLLGLLGTVVGMIKAFIAVEQLGGRVNATVLAGGIWEAMLTTALGLMVAIPLIVLHSYLEGRLRSVQAELEEVAVNIVKNWRW